MYLQRVLARIDRGRRVGLPPSSSDVEYECAALSRHALDSDLATLKFCKLTGDPETKAGASIVLIRLLLVVSHGQFGAVYSRTFGDAWENRRNISFISSSVSPLPVSLHAN